MDVCWASFCACIYWYFGLAAVRTASRSLARAFRICWSVFNCSSSPCMGCLKSLLLELFIFKKWMLHGNKMIILDNVSVSVWLWLLIFIFQNEFRISRSIQPGVSILYHKVNYNNLSDNNDRSLTTLIKSIFCQLQSQFCISNAQKTSVNYTWTHSIVANTLNVAQKVFAHVVFIF